MSKVRKKIRFKDGKLSICDQYGNEISLGGILTRKGALTREQKIHAVAAFGKWIEI